jgi:hypothetical protein
MLFRSRSTGLRWNQEGLVFLLCTLLAAALVVILAVTPAAAQDAADAVPAEPRFLPDDPIALDPDRLDMPAPEEQEPSDVGDYISNTFFSPADYDGPARNANTVQEVPASSWYTPRHYQNRLSIEALQRGPDTRGADGPAPGPWTVVSTKEEGKSVGMQIEDARGDRYLLKFDPPGNMELTTGAEVVSTKLFYALGYHVPENFAVAFQPERLEVGEEVSLSRDGLRDLLGKAAHYADGSIRAIASKFVDGSPIGPFQYYGTRPDDGNDVFPHESRRELRGMHVFAAWLNHVDSRGSNSLDTVVEDVSPVTGDSAQYVRHHLIDFGTTLGGGPLGPKDRWQGFEYSIEPGRMIERTVTLGFSGAPWLNIEYPGYPSIGHIEAEHFEPEEWKPLYPNPAFQRMDAADAFWAARQVMHFTDEELRAVVETGDYSDPEAEAYLAKTLMKRRDKIGRAYLGYGGGVDRFRVEGGRLTFDDLPAVHGLAPEDRARRVTWRVFDNETAEAGRVLDEETTARESLAVPEARAARFLLAEIETPEGSGAITRVYLRRTGGAYEVVGLSREGEAAVGEDLPVRAAAPSSGERRDGGGR